MEPWSIDAVQVRYDGELDVHPRVAYLALNYVDRFLSKRQLPCEHKTWAPRLLAISCLSLASKMQRAAAISVADIQRGEEFMFDEATIRRMERVVLGALEWRARSVTPLAFLGFFLSACFPQPRHPPLLAAIKARAVDLLLRVQPEVKMAEFAPSVTAAAALLAAAGEVAGAHIPAFHAVVAACPFVNSVSMIFMNFVSSKITPLIPTYLRSNPCHVWHSPARRLLVFHFHI
ncbi:hypothetical protein E2562_000907 [Oryza meyeriana var. granulata]|uniref:Cyclin-like domain-containing protein n=1 Tax=Oryza meyeriana var. granulata TaxID=110450 RepID=A0A6G1CYE6_9ORYZ|nr:hypothetical protein E2562_000907 [Oryza meyeriana var. granulata]